MRFIDHETISHKIVLLRVDYNISFDSNHHIANDERIRQSLPTIELLLKNHNTIILLSHLGRPYGKDEKLSLKPVVQRLEKLLHKQVHFIDDIDALTDENIRNTKTSSVYLFENIRFFKGEEENDLSFAKKLAATADIYVNDAFSVSHRVCASITQLPKLLPSFGGLLMRNEIETISAIIIKPQHPIVAILGGAKVSSKIGLLYRLVEIADFVLLGGGLANTVLFALKNPVGRSLVEKNSMSAVMHILKHAKDKNTKIIVPSDVIVGDREGKHATRKIVHMITNHDMIYDIGPETQAIFAQAILQAKTIIWNGPMGMFEQNNYQRGTDFIYYSIIANQEATSIVGGGETIAAISHQEHLEKITHVSTGGGALLEFIEKGTLPGIEALKGSES